jgi:hypothetical protein
MMIACLLTSTELGAFTSISITLGCISINICTYVDGCTFTWDTSSSPTSFCVVYAFTNCRSTPLFSFDFSMFIESTYVIPSLAYTLELQPIMCFHEIFITNILIIFISWIIICTNCFFSMYISPSSHSKDDGECGGNFIANNWMFNTHVFSTILNSSFVFFSNSFASSSCLRLHSRFLCFLLPWYFL